MYVSGHFDGRKACHVARKLHMGRSCRTLAWPALRDAMVEELSFSKLPLLS